VTGRHSNQLNYQTGKMYAFLCFKSVAKITVLFNSAILLPEKIDFSLHTYR